MATTETTPLLTPKPVVHHGASSVQPRSWASTIFSVENRVLFVGFLISVSFSYTQVPLFFAFRLMTCDVFYDKHPPFEGTGDRCLRDEITSATAIQWSILSMTTTIFGTVNLFIAGWSVKRLGLRAALQFQVLVPAVRVATQIIGVIAGKTAGMIIIQSTQAITVLGGPAGYILVMNIIVAELIEPARRTAVFGKLQGAFMMGQGLGYLAGGQIGELFQIRAPFDVAFVSFLVSAAVCQTTLPYMDPKETQGKKGSQHGSGGFLAPLRILVPQRLRLVDGQIRKHYGVIILCLGIFIGVVSTGMVHGLLQMYAASEFDFDQAENGYLVAGFSFMRSIFLIFIFPPIIHFGRKYVTAQPISSTQPEPSSPTSESPLLPTEPESIPAATTEPAVSQPLQPSDPSKDEEEVEFCLFDLIFLRWSLLVDGLLTALVAFAYRGWHMYLLAFLLPFGSGSAPAARGVVTQMCPPSQKADALNAVTLVENVARLTTTALFGFIFAALAEVGQAHLTFYCNAAVAVIGMLVLLFSHFPPEGAKILDSPNETGEETEEI